MPYYASFEFGDTSFYLIMPNFYRHHTIYTFSGLWVGWPGLYLANDEIIPESDPTDTTPTAGLKSDQVVPVNLNSEDYELYYNGCCNATFWPLFHSMPDR
jgi:trehalose-6-phosphate synthase